MVDLPGYENIKLSPEKISRLMKSLDKEDLINTIYFITRALRNDMALADTFGVSEYLTKAEVLFHEALLALEEED